MDSAGRDSADADPRPVTGPALAPVILRIAPAIDSRVRWRKDGGASMSVLRRILVIALVAAVVSCLFFLSYGYATHDRDRTTFVSRWWARTERRRA